MQEVWLKQLKLWKQLSENQSERQRKRISKRNFPIPRSGEETTQKCEGREAVHMASTKKGQVFSSAENASHLLNLSHMGKDVGTSSKIRILGNADLMY